MPEPAKRAVYRTWMADSRRWDAYRPRAGDIIVATYPQVRNYMDAADC